MNIKTLIQTLAALTALMGFVFASPISMASGHGDEAETVEEAKGPHGGKWLQRDDIAVELTMYETGVPPEMRVYVYQGELLLPATATTLEVALNRLGGDKDVLTFHYEDDYWVSQQSVPEPHSYDVSINVTVKGKQYNWQYPSHEGRSTIAPRILESSGIKTAVAGPQTLNLSRQLFGVIETPIDRMAGIFAPYPSVLEKIHVSIGQRVKRGQVIATLRNIKTLQSYSAKSPIDGEVSDWMASIGQRVDEDLIAQVVDLSKVWLEMSAFPEDIEKLALGQKVVAADMHQHEQAEGEIIYIAPKMTGGHIARARALIDNPQGHWRPGMHVKATVTTQLREVSLAVEKRALQTFRESDVVFAKFGDTFEVRMLDLGESDERFVEILSGLKAGAEYATENSFIIKADVLKDGASHDH